MHPRNERTIIELLGKKTTNGTVLYSIYIIIIVVYKDWDILFGEIKEHV